MIKESNVNLDDFDYDENAPAQERGDFSHLKAQAETKIKIIKEFLNEKLKGCEYEITPVGLENAENINSVEFPIDIISVNEEEAMYIITDAESEIKGKDIVLPNYIDKELIKKVVAKIPSKLLKIVKYTKSN